MLTTDKRPRNYAAITCRDCGEIHFPNSGNSKRCRACTMKSRSQTGVGFLDRSCYRCSQTYKPASSSQRFCITCRPVARAEYNVTHLMEARRASGATEIGTERICSDCGLPYAFKHGPQKRCNPCQIAHNRHEMLEATKRSPLRGEYRKRTKAKRAFGGNKQAVMARDHYACRKCSATDRLCVHHIDGMGKGVPRDSQNHDMDNLITLCATCHRRVHVITEKLFFLRHAETAREALALFIASGGRVHSS